MTVGAPIFIDYLSLLVYAQRPDTSSLSLNEMRREAAEESVRRENLHLTLVWAPSVFGDQSANRKLPFRAYGARLSISCKSGRIYVSGRGATLPAPIATALLSKYELPLRNLMALTISDLSGIRGATYFALDHKVIDGTGHAALGFVGGREVSLRGDSIEYHSYSDSEGNPMVESGARSLVRLRNDLSGLLPLSF